MAKRKAPDFANMPNELIEQHLLKLCIGERFVGDVAWLTRLYDEDYSFEKMDDLNAALRLANPKRHSSICPPLNASPGFTIN